MKFKLITEPAVEPLDLSQIKTYHRINGDDQDDVMSALMVAARQFVEDHTGRPLITQTWEGVSRSWENFFTYGMPDRLRVPVSRCEPLKLKANLQSVVSVEYYDEDGTLQTLDTADYNVITHGILGEVWPAFGTQWPVTQDRPDAIKVTFVAGYGDEAGDVPKPIWQAMMLLFGHFFENREATTPVMIRELPLIGGRDTVGILLAPYAVPVVR